MGHVSTNRLRLHLLSEKSMGLSSVPVGRRRKGETRAPARAPLTAPPTASNAPTVLNAMADVLTHRVQPRPAAAPAVKEAASASRALRVEGLTVAEPFAAPLHSTGEKTVRLQQMDAGEVKGCTFCALCNSRTSTVFGEGNVDARLMFVGEGPGATEDETGRPFVGDAGQLLDKQIAAMGLERAQVFICNIVKCRPPGNRVPIPDEMAACTPYLLRQIEIIRPEVIVSLGLTATSFLLQSKGTMGSLRGNWHTFRGIALMPTWHPAYLLRNRTVKTRGEVWSDLQQVMGRLGLQVKSR